MTCEYTYDTLNRLTAIEYLSGANVLDGFYYELDDVGNITKTTHEDGVYWDYEYDNRYRLTSAVRSHASGNIKATYEYTYDDGDNMITKVEPFMDDFNDGNYTGWTTAGGGSWTASNTYLEATGETGWSRIYKSTSDADNECVFRYRFDDLTAPGNVYIYPRHVDGSNHVYVGIYPTQMRIGKTVSGTHTLLQYNNAATSAEDTWYNVRIVADGSTVTVWRWADGDMPTQVLSSSNTSITTTSNYRFEVGPGGDVDAIRIHVDDLSNTTTFAVNNANELTTMTDPNGTTTFGFDAWGRMTSKERGSYGAEYGYKYGQMLASVDTNWPGEANVSYEYQANRRQKQRNAGGTSEIYKWQGSNEVINQEDGSGDLTNTFVNGPLAEVSGDDPANGTWRFHTRDVLGSVRASHGPTGTTLGLAEYDPFGNVHRHSGLTSSRGFAGLGPESATSMNYAILRYQIPWAGRWMSRDSFGFVDGTNLYGYVSNNPINALDPSGGFAVAIPFCGVGALAVLAVGSMFFNASCPSGKCDSSPPRLPDIDLKPLAQSVTNANQVATVGMMLAIATPFCMMNDDDDGIPPWGLLGLLLTPREPEVLVPTVRARPELPDPPQPNVDCAVLCKAKHPNSNMAFWLCMAFCTGARLLGLDS